MGRRIATITIVFALLAPLSLIRAATGTIAPFPQHQFLDDSGDPCNGCLLFTYASGSSTKLSTFSEVTLSSSNANPLTLPSDGRATIFLTPGLSYKFVLAPANDSDPPAAPIWTQDNVSAVPPASTSADADIVATAGTTVAAGDCVAWSDGSGGGTAGRVYPCDADFVYLSSTATRVGIATAAISTGSSGTIRVEGRATGLTGLVAGTNYFSSATAGALTSTAPTNARLVGIADSTTSLVLYGGTREATSAVPGGLNLTAQTITGAKTFSSAPIFSAGATWPSALTLGDFKWACSSSNFTKNANTTLGDVTGLAFTVAASDRWIFWILLHAVSSTTADWKMTLTGPAAATALRFGFVIDTSAGASDASAFSSTIFGNGQGVDEGMLIIGELRNGANAGTVQLQAAQNTSDATNSVIYAESCLVALKVS